MGVLYAFYIYIHVYQALNLIYLLASCIKKQTEERKKEIDRDKEKKRMEGKEKGKNVFKEDGWYKAEE